MVVNIGSREYLTPFEIVLLVNGVRAAIVEDRYISITIHAKRGVCNQIKLITRWVGREDPHEDIVTLVES